MGLGLLQVASVSSTLWKIFEDFEVRKGSFEKRSVEGPRKGCGQEVFGDVQNQRELNNTDHIARTKATATGGQADFLERGQHKTEELFQLYTTMQPDLLSILRGEDRT